MGPYNNSSPAIIDGDDGLHAVEGPTGGSAGALQWAYPDSFRKEYRGVETTLEGHRKIRRRPINCRCSQPSLLPLDRSGTLCQRGQSGKKQHAINKQGGFTKWSNQGNMERIFQPAKDQSYVLLCQDGIGQTEWKSQERANVDVNGDRKGT